MSGYSGPRYDISREEKRLREAFRDQRKMAERRGIIFSLTYSQWLKIWLDSGHLAQRGCRRGQYVMSRPGDRGPYSVSNSRVVRVESNQQEAWVGRPHSLRTRSRMSVAHEGQPRTVEGRYA
jgi:hypothetical protein